MKTTRFLALAALLSLSTAARADFITGQVVDSMGVGIAGVDIDAKNLGGGGNPNIMNDGTDVNGFFTTTIPNGLYRLTFTPPPGSPNLVLEIDNFVVVGTTAMGQVALSPGTPVSGRFITTGGAPIAGINVDAVVAATGTAVDPLPNDVSDAFGQFTIVVPQVETIIEIKPNLLSGLAPQAFTVNSTTAFNLGDITMVPGFLLTAFIRNGNTLAALTGVDLDVVDTVTKQTLFTPGDNSMAGVLDVVVPAGTYDLEFCPNIATGLAPQGLSVVVTGALNVGNVDLPTGILLNGTITDSMGAPVQGADVDLNDSTTGLAVVLCNDDSNASGVYAVRAPAGNYTVTFSKAGFTDIVVTGVALNATTLLNGQFSGGGGSPFADSCNGDGGDQMGCTSCPCGNNAPMGTIGGCLNSAGTASRLGASGDTSVSLPAGSSTDLQFTMSGGPAVATSVLLSGNAVAPTNVANPCFGLNSGSQAADRDGLRCVVQSVLRHGNRQTNATGDIMDAAGPNRVWGGPAQPNSGIAASAGFVAGQTRYFQVTHRDNPAAVCMRGLNTSQAVEVTFTP